MPYNIMTVSVTTTGVAGSATGNTDSDPIQGEILAIALNYHASAPATSDVTIKALYPFDYNILVVSNNATDTFYTPRAKPVDNANAAITDSHAPFAVWGKVNIAVAQSDALTGAVVATIFYRR